MTTPAQFIKRMKKSFVDLAEEYGDDPPELKIPTRYRDFLATGEYLTFQERPGVSHDGAHTYKFVDDYLIDHFASSEAYDSIRAFLDKEGKQAFAFWPFSQLLGGPGKSSSVALYVDLSDDKCPIYRWDEGDVRLQAASLDDFLRALDEKHVTSAPKLPPGKKAKPAADAELDLKKHLRLAEQFWQIEATATMCTITEGTLGTRGRFTTFHFSSPREREKEVKALIKEKVKKGYKENGEFLTRDLLPTGPRLSAPATEDDVNYFFQLVRDGDAAELKLEIDRGLDPNCEFTPREFGKPMSALWYALMSGKKACVQTLIEGGANVKVVDSEGRTLLHHPISWSSTLTEDEQLAIAQQLIAKGFDVNAANAEGFTVLHSAAGLGSVARVKLLVAKGARIGVKDKLGRTPLDLAKAKNATEVCAVLQGAAS